MEKKYAEWFWDPFESEEYSFNNRDRYRKKKENKTIILMKDNKNNNSFRSSFKKGN